MENAIVRVPTLPAASVAVTVTVCAPRALTTTGAVYGPATPPSMTTVLAVTPMSSADVAVTVTGPVYAVVVPVDGGPAGESATVGAVVSGTGTMSTQSSL